MRNPQDPVLAMAATYTTKDKSKDEVMEDIMVLF
jgi:hypothetical protein